MKLSTNVFYGMALLAGSAVFVALSTPLPVQAQAPGRNVCLNVIDIQNTKPTDIRTIIYTMKNGDVWRNDLATPCPDLIHHSAGGYVQKSSIGGWICANTQLI